MTDSLKRTAQITNELKGKVIVIDTSSLLMAGTKLLTVLPKSTVIIPAIVIKELENKRTHSTIGFMAREWLNLIESIRVESGKELSKGVVLKEYKDITLRVEPNHTNQKTLPSHLQDGSNDSTILAVANNLSLELQEEGRSEEVIILSNDVPMRIAATLDLSLGAFEFNATQIVGAKPFDGRYSIQIPFKEFENSKDLYFTIINYLPKNYSKSAYVQVEYVEGGSAGDFIISNGEVQEVKRKNKASNITARTLEQDIALAYLKESPDNLPIVSLGGGAGTGKTLLTIAVGLDELRAKHYQKVIVFRSLHEMGQGQEMGFLPGDVNDKMEAWAGAVFDALDVLAAAKKTIKKNAGPHAELALKEESKKLREMIEVSPITYLRGRSLSNTYIVLEEAQNFSRNEILNILSRAGEGSKIVLTFDAAQVDNKFLQSGKNSDIWSVIDSLKSEDLFAHITLQKTERSRVAELASRILEG